MDPASSLPEPPEPAPLRRLRRLVSVLLVVMIAGIICVVGLLAWRLMTVETLPELPAELVLPEGQSLAEASVGRQWITLIARDPAGQVWVHVADRSGTIQASVPVAAD